MGSVAGPGARLRDTREQEARLAGHVKDYPCNDLPDIQDPRVSIRPLALPIMEWSASPIKGCERSGIEGFNYYINSRYQNV